MEQGNGANSGNGEEGGKEEHQYTEKQNEVRCKNRRNLTKQKEYLQI